MGGAPQQAVALLKSFADQAEVELREIAQSAVDKFGGSTGCARGEVCLFYQADPVPPGRGIKGHTGTRDPAANDEDIDPLAKSIDRAPPLR